MLQVRLSFMLVLGFLEKAVNTDLLIYSPMTSPFSIWEHNNVELTCDEPNASPNSNRIEWRNIPTNEVSSQKQLQIINISRYDSHSWRCLLLSESGQTLASKQIQLNVIYLDAPKVSVLYNNKNISSRSEYVIRKYGNITWSCTPRTNIMKNTTIYWTKNGDIIKHGETLQMYNVSLDDTGYYQCITELLGRASESKWLKTVVQYMDPPSIYSAFDTEIRERFSIYLRCDVNRSGDNTFRWYKDGSFFSNSNQLAIETASVTDGANYTCAVTDGIDTYNVTRAVNVYYIRNPYTRLVTPEPIIEGSYFQMECKVSTNHEKPSFYWYKEMQSVVSRSRLLTIDNISRYYGGSYTCFASLMGLGRFTSSFHLEIHYMDEPSITTQKTILTEGEAVLLTCNVVAFASPQYFWYKDGYLINNTENIFHIKNVNRDDTGGYECTTANAVGNKTAMVNITVHFVDVPTITVNESLLMQKMNCHVNSSITTGLSYLWYHNDLALKNGSEIYVNRTRSNSGKYICRVSFKEMIKESEPYLYVEPFIEAPNVTLLTTPVRESATINIMCEARGYPAPSYEWLKSNVTLPAETSPILAIRNVQRSDNGIYACRNRNVKGETEAGVNMFVHFISKPYIEWRVYNSLSQMNAHEPLDWSFAEGESVTLRCMAITSLKMDLQYTWYYNNKLLSIFTNIVELTNLTSDDDGRYRCRVFGMNITKESDDNQLIVGYFHGIMVRSISTESVLLNQAFALECLVITNLNLQKEWKHNTVANLSSVEDVFFSSNQTVLYVSHMKKDLVGTFTCIAFNEKGMRKTASYDVHIADNKTTVTPTKSIRVVSKWNLTLNLNDTSGIVSIKATKSARTILSVQPKIKNDSRTGGSCSENWNPCHQDGICHILHNGNHICTCKEGFLGNGHSCKKTCNQFDVLLKIFVVAVLLIVILLMVIVAMMSGIIGQNKQSKRDRRKVAVCDGSNEENGYIETNANIFMAKDASTEKTIGEEGDNDMEAGENQDENNDTVNENENEKQQIRSENYQPDENVRPSSDMPKIEGRRGKEIRKENLVA